MKKIILFSGYAESGKDTVADMVAAKLQGKSVKIAMADYLKYIATKYYHWDGKKNEHGRDILQYLGTDLIRDSLGWQTFHVERVCQDIKIISDDYDYVLIPDVRFKNEMHFVMAMFPGMTTSIRVNRPLHENNLTEEQRRHRSETEMAAVKSDYEICTGEGLKELERVVDKTLGTLITGLNSEISVDN